MVSVPKARYASAFDAACAAARAEGLVPEVADRESGTLETSSRLAGSVIEPWAWSDLTASDVIEGTFGYERRRAHFEFVPAGFRPASPSASADGSAPLAGPILPGSERGVGSDLPTSLPGGTEEIEVRVTVSVERQFRPGYQGPAYTRALGSYSRDDDEDDTGIDPRRRNVQPTGTWTPVARDERLERVLMARVGELLGRTP